MSGNVSRLIVQGSLTGFVFLNFFFYNGRKHSEWIFEAAGEDKSMTQAFHSEADNIPVTFPGKCQGLDGFMGLAGDTAQETKWGGGGDLCIPSSYAKECHCDRARGWDKVCLQISCFFFTSMPTQGPSSDRISSENPFICNH